jgi:SAM-dependent methyltransferase
VIALKTFLITCLLLLGAIQEPGRDSGPPVALDVSELARGTNAPHPAAFAEALRVAAVEHDPDAQVRLLEETGSVELRSTPDGITAARKRLDVMRAASSPTERITGEMLYVQGTATPDGTGRFFFDREIALIMGHLGANWLERPTREREERTSKLVELLGVEKDSSVADIGAGTGYFTFPIAKKASEGVVHAIDIQPEMLEFIEARKRTEGVTNIRPALGAIDDARLEPESIDLALAVDAYHEFSHPWEMLESLKKALRPGGRLILVEFRLEDPEVPIKRLHKMSEAQARRELEAAGFEWVRTEDCLPRQHVLIFQKPPSG